MTRKSYESALEARGYTVLLSVGFGEGQDGSYSLKIAASPVLKTLPEESWDTVRTTMIRAIDMIRKTPLDDLEWE